jgi:membrane protease YdiL (CAAX protease family)
MEQPSDTVDRYEAVRQYSLAQILGVWAAAAVPMGVLAWIVAPWLRDQLGGRDPFIEALLICLTAGLIWQLVLVLILVKRELGGLQWSRVRDALWLQPPRDPKTRRVGGRVWWWVLPFVVLSGLINALPIYPTGPAPRDLPNLLDTDRAEHFFSGAWGWFALLVVIALFAPWVEELLFRGLLLPRMRAAIGRRDWVANGAPVRRLPPAPAVEHAVQRARRHLRSGLSHAAIPEHLDGAHHAHGSEFRHHRCRTRPRALAVLSLWRSQTS